MLDAGRIVDMADDVMTEGRLQQTASFEEQLVLTEGETVEIVAVTAHEM